MSFREKRAWVELASLLAVYGVYVALYGRSWFPTGTADFGPPIVGLVVVLILVQIVLMIGLTLTSRGEARAPFDERDRMIDLASARAGFIALQAGAFMVLIDVWIHASPALIANSVLLTMASGEAVRSAWKIIGYRRSAA